MPGLVENGLSKRFGWSDYCEGRDIDSVVSIRVSGSDFVPVVSSCERKTW